MPEPLKLHTALELRGQGLASLLVPACPHGNVLPAWPSPRDPVYLLIRNQWRWPRTVAVPSVNGDQHTVAVRRAQSAKKPVDYIVGPLGAGTVTYPSGPGGLSVVAHTLTSGTPEGGHASDPE